MRIRFLNRVVLAACIAAVLSAAPTSAMGAPARLAAHSRLAARVRPAENVLADWLPMGGVVRNTIPAGFCRVYGIPLYAGQTVHFEMYTNGADGHELDLADSDDSHAGTYVASSTSGNPLAIDYIATTVVESGVTYDWSVYEVVLFGPEGSTVPFTLRYTISDPPVTRNVHRVFGADRFATSASTADWAFDATGTVVIATGRNYADALAASALCGSYSAPLLLTDTNQLPSCIANAVTALGANRAFVIGGRKAVSDNVVSHLPAGVTAERIEGGDRFATAAAIAKEVRRHELQLGRAPATNVFLASGRGFADALAASPYAYSQRMPIILTEPTVLPTVSRSAIASLGASNVIVVGGRGTSAAPVVSAEVTSTLPPGVTSERVFGVDRVQTASTLAGFAVARGWASWSQVGIATGYDYPDALGGGVAIGRRNGVLLLIPGLIMPDSTYETLYDHRSDITDCALFGSSNVLTGAMLGWADDALLGNALE